VEDESGFSIAALIMALTYASRCWPRCLVVTRAHLGHRTGDRDIAGFGMPDVTDV
jgi:hypothetical protein